MFFIIAYNFLSSCILLLSKHATNYASPLLITMMRTGIAAAISFASLFFYNKNQLQLFKKISMFDYAAICLVGLFHSFLRSILSFWAMQYVSGTDIALMLYLTPFFCAGFSYLVWDEKLTWYQWIGIFISVMGVCILESNYIFSSLLQPQALAVIILLIAIMSNACGMIIMRYLLHHRQIPIACVTSGSLLCAHGLSLVGFVAAPSLIMIKESSLQSIGFFIGIIFIISLLHSMNMYMKSWLIKKYSATSISLSYFMMPLWTSLFGYIFFQEVIHLQSIIAFFVITLGLFIFYKQK